jgi:hypothetical protein
MRLKLQHLPEPVADRLRRFHLVQQLRRVARWGLATLALYGVLLLVAVQLDRFLFLDTGFRVGLWWAVHGLAAAVGLVGLAALILRRHTSREVAYAFESSLKQKADESYVTLDDVMSRGGGAATGTRQEMIGQLSHGAVEHARQPLRRVPSRDRVLRFFGMLVVGIALTMGGLLALPGYRFGLMLHRFYRPDAALPKPSFLQIDVAPAEPVVGKGEDLALQVTVQGSLPKWLEWLYRKAGHSSSRCVMAMGPADAPDFRFDAGARVDLSRVDRNLFLYSKADVVSNFSFVVRCGDAQTAVRKVEVVTQPVVTEVILQVTPPAYSGLPGQTVTNQTQPLSCLPGSRIAVTFRTDQPVLNREVRFEKVPRPQAHTWDEPARTGRFEFTLKQRAVFEIVVRNRHGFTNRERVRTLINLRDDLPPTVQLDDPSADVEKVAGELITFRAGISDDLGLQDVSLRYLLNPDPDSELPMKELPVATGLRSLSSTNVVVDFDLERIGAAPGDLVLLQLRARDTAGNDGVSREVRVRVLPFTRDENERMRLRALLFVQEVLGANIEAGLPPFSGGDRLTVPMSDRAAEAVKAAARKAGLTMADGNTWGPLFDLLEREHHFTDRPRHKDDVRRLRAVLWKTMGLPPVKGAAASGDVRVGDLRRLYTAVLPGLCRLRQAKNLTWRMFGMLQETERIAVDLDRPVESPSPAARSLERRLQLYLAAIQDLGEELMVLNQTAKWVAPEVLKQQVSELNTAAYSVKRGSAGRRRAACRQVAEGLAAMLEGLRPAYVRLLKDETISRARLETLYQKCLIGTVKPVGDLTKADYGDAAAWLEEDGRLMASNPFLPLWPRCVNLALLNGLEDVGGGMGVASSKAAEAGRRQAAALLLDPVAAGDRIERDRRRLQRMAFEWENRTALAEPVGSLEKVLQLSLSEMEEAAANAEDGGLAEGRLTRLAGLMNGGESVIASFGFRDAQSLSGLLNSADPDLMPEYIRANHLLPAPLVFQRRLSERFGPNTVKLEAFSRGREAITPAASRQLADILIWENRALQELADALELTVCTEGPARPSSRLEWLLITVREQRQRLAVTTRPSLLALRKLGAASAGGAEASTVAVPLDECLAVRESIGKAIDAWGVALVGGRELDEAEKTKFPVLVNFDRSRDVYGVLLKMREAEAKPVELSRMMRDRYPDLAQGYLAEGLRFVDAAMEHVRTAEADLRRDPPGLAPAVTQLISCRGALKLFQQHVDRAGPGETQARMRRVADELVRQIGLMKPGESRQEAETVSRLMFAMGEVRQGLMTLRTDLKAASQTAMPRMALSGGPDGVWEASTRVAAERSRRRLSQQMELAERMGTRGILEAGTAEGQSPTGGLISWGALVFAVDRSELNPTGGVRAGAAGADDQASLLVKYLRDEIQKARQMPGLKHGAEYVGPYLDALYDYLRY